MSKRINMISYIFLSLCLFVLLPDVDGINCVSCVGWSHSGCNDPYDETTSGDLPVPGNKYCAKVVYPSYVERMAGGRSCTPGSGPGSSIIYCCSDKDYCNGSMKFTGLTTLIILSILILLFA
ncbi:hypothetical protein I4U23_001278 [Adineta vaga]|nr:hypothetical protein I4U23_001278 [Adineta vaga]